MSAESTELAGIGLVLSKLVDATREATNLVDEHWKRLHARADALSARLAAAERMEAMTDPVAALREYVRAESSQRRTGGHAEGALLNSATGLLAYVERLEAALVGLVCGTSEDEREAYRVGREIAGRRP